MISLFVLKCPRMLGGIYNEEGFPFKVLSFVALFLSLVRPLYICSLLLSSVALYEIRQVNKIQSFVDFAYFDECSTRILLAGHIAHIFIATCTLSAQFITLMAP